MAVRGSIPLILLALSGNVSAIGLGELRGQSSLGENLRLEIDLLGADKGTLDASCFRLVQPTSGGDLPFLKKAKLTIRRSTPPVLEIHSALPLREPILQLAVQVGCGQEVSREYVFLASPVNDAAPREPAAVDSLSVARPSLPRTTRPERVATPPKPPARLAPKPVEKPNIAKESPRRLILTNGSDVGEPSLRLVSELLSRPGAEPTEAQREILRLEFRMLIALHDQATTQLGAAEKLRTMESTLGDLQQRTTEFAQRLEQGSAPAALPPPDVAVTGQSAGEVSKPQEAPLPSVAQSVPPPSPLPAPTPPAEPEDESSLSEWTLYGVLFGALLGLAGWLGWKNYRARQQRLTEADYPFVEPECEVDPWLEDESRDVGAIDLQVEPVAQGASMAVDLDLGHADEEPLVPREISIKAPDSVFSISDTTVDEYFEANPVMELADIMLSFGRVKGAAQALQEYIDNNPQEALQPWIRLIEVYRMAGMREEFEAMALNLNKNFNVEVQHWDASERKTDEQALDLVLDDAPHAPLPQCLEDMPRLMAMIVELWPSSDVVGYLYQLLRDNRGGQRAGFSLPVVEEILFLVELKDTANRFQKDGSDE